MGPKLNGVALTSFEMVGWPLSNSVVIKRKEEKYNLIWKWAIWRTIPNICTRIEKGQ